MKPQTVASAVVFAVAVAALDYLTGYELRCDILYLVPVWLLAKPGQQRIAVVMAFIVVALWTTVDFGNGHVYQNAYARYWNMAELLIGALAVASFGSRLPAAVAVQPALALAGETHLEHTAAYARSVMRRLESDASPRRAGAHSGSQSR